MAKWHLTARLSEEQDEEVAVRDLHEGSRTSECPCASHCEFTLLRRWLSLCRLDRPERTGPASLVVSKADDEVVEERGVEEAVRAFHHDPRTPKMSGASRREFILLRCCLSLWRLDHPGRNGPASRDVNVAEDDVVEDHGNEEAVRVLHHGETTRPACRRARRRSGCA